MFQRTSYLTKNYGKAEGWTLPVYDELFNLTGDAGASFDDDHYAVNVASEHPTLVKTLRAKLEAAVKSWY